MDIGLWLPLWEIVEARRRELGEDALDEDERLWLYLRHLIDEVEDQGLLGFYCADLPPDPLRVLQALQQLEAEEMCNVFERVQALLPEGQPPEDDAAREALIALWSDDDDYAKLLAELEDDFYELLPETEQLLDQTVLRVMAKYET